MLDIAKEKDKLKKYAHPKKELNDCIETLSLLYSEDSRSNNYITLAINFEKYKNGLKEESADWYFYKYLQTLERKDQYIFSCGEEEIIIDIDIFNPFITINEKKVVNPQWHLIISFYAYIDAMINHDDNIYAKEIKNMPDYPKLKRFNFSCKSLKKWIEEAF